MPYLMCCLICLIALPASAQTSPAGIERAIEADAAAVAAGVPATQARRGTVVRGVGSAPSAGGTRWSAWASADAWRFAGDGAGLSFGIDRAFGPAVIGLAVRHGRLDAGLSTRLRHEAETLLVGPYLSIDLTGVDLDGYLLYGEPDHDDAGGTSFGTERIVYGASTGISDLATEALVLSPSAYVRGVQERTPAVTVAGVGVNAPDLNAITGAAGLRAELDLRAVRPYVTMAGELTALDDGTGSTEDRFAPALGAGLVADTAVGAVQVDIDGGQLSDGTNDYGAVLSYRLRF